MHMCLHKIKCTCARIINDYREHSETDVFFLNVNILGSHYQQTLNIENILQRGQALKFLIPEEKL